MMSFRAASALALLLPLFGHAEVHAPRAGVVRYQNGAVHSLFGLGSSYVVSKTPLTSAVASAFSDRFGLIADGTSLNLLDENLAIVASLSCAEMRPVLGVGETSESAVAWLPAQSAIVTFDGHSFVKTPARLPAGPVIAISIFRGTTFLALQLQADGSIFQSEVSTGNSEVISSKPLLEAHGAAALLAGSVISFFNSKLHIASVQGNAPLVEIPFVADGVAFEQSSSRSLHLYSLTGAGNWMLYHDGNRWTLAELPTPVATR